MSYVVIYIRVKDIVYNTVLRVKDSVVHRSCQQSLVAKWLGLCVQLGLGLGLGLGDGIICFFFLCVKVTKTCVLLVPVQRSDVRPTLRDVMMM